MRESDILFESGPYWICREQFGSGRFKPKSNGFAVYKTGITHSVRVASIGYEGEKGLQRAKQEIVRRLAENEFTEAGKIA